MTVAKDVIDLYCRAAQEYAASDLILHEGNAPVLRVSGSITPLDAPHLTSQDFDEFRKACGVTTLSQDHDARFISSDGVRFRVNFHQHLGGQGAVLRRINSTPPSIESLGVPVDRLCGIMKRRSGMFIVSGSTGSGKSTTLASLLDWVNHHFERHIVTIEDPVEYIFERDRSIFTQRAVGMDTDSFAEGLRRSLRQAPDIIMVGEIRDAETAGVALRAAQTGHLVLASLHTHDAPGVLYRIVDNFPGDEQEQILGQLANTLCAILAQRLVPTEDGSSRVMATELLINSSAVSSCIRDRRFEQMVGLMEIGRKDGMHTFDNSLEELYLSNRISKEEAMAGARNPVRLEGLRRVPPKPAI
jgi:twitching motility protein PilT